MVEKVILDYLNSVDNLPDVYAEIPADPPTAFYVIEKTGSRRENRIYHSTFAVKSYAATLYAAAQANETVKDLMLDGLIGEPEVIGVSLNSDYNFTDTEEKRYRYQAVFDISHY